MDHDPLANAINRLADSLQGLAQALSPEAQQTPAAQAALDLLLRDSKRIGRRLSALDAIVTPPIKQPKE